MINQNEILDTIHMIDQQHLDIRTITMGISLRDCCGPDPKMRRLGSQDCMPQDL